MTGPRILIVEDEPRVADFLARGLNAEGYAVELARDGEDGLAKARGAAYAAILLDLLLPKMDGRAVCQALRRGGDHTPILMLTAMDAIEDRVEGLLMGADDYLTKPFAFDELVARLFALMRRCRPAPGPASGPASAASSRAAEPRLLQCGEVVLDRAARAVTRGGRRMELSGKELDLLELLMSEAGRVVGRERILATVWGSAEEPLTNIVEVYIRRLRRKLEEEPDGAPVIVTVRGHGYRFDGDF